MGGMQRWKYWRRRLRDLEIEDWVRFAVKRFKIANHEAKKEELDACFVENDGFGIDSCACGGLRRAGAGGRARCTGRGRRAGRPAYRDPGARRAAHLHRPGLSAAIGTGGRRAAPGRHQVQRRGADGQRTHRLRHRRGGGDSRGARRGTLLCHAGLDADHRRQLGGALGHQRRLDDDHTGAYDQALLRPALLHHTGRFLRA